MYKLHGLLPKNIISDRDVLFTGTFCRQLHRFIGTTSTYEPVQLFPEGACEQPHSSKLRLSSAYHPQLDGSTERANCTVTQMSNQRDWVNTSKSPAIEFAINSASA